MFDLYFAILVPW